MPFITQLSSNKIEKTVSRSKMDTVKSIIAAINPIKNIEKAVE